jgi:hypothetical protein
VTVLTTFGNSFYRVSVEWQEERTSTTNRRSACFCSSTTNCSRSSSCSSPAPSSSLPTLCTTRPLLIVVGTTGLPSLLLLLLGSLR